MAKKKQNLIDAVGWLNKVEGQRQEIIDMVVQIKRDKYLDMIQGFVKKLWDIENEQQPESKTSTDKSTESKTSIDKFID